LYPTLSLMPQTLRKPNSSRYRQWYCIVSALVHW